MSTAGQAATMNLIHGMEYAEPAHSPSNGGSSSANGSGWCRVGLHYLLDTDIPPTDYDIVNTTISLRGVVKMCCDN